MLGESEWNYHFGSNHDMRPHVSDNKYRMAGRETGHFGSGTYFSTYKGESSIDGYEKNLDPHFIQLSDNLYRVDFDLYKNLYRVRSKKQGDVLYTMLADLNHMYNRISYMGHFNMRNAYYSNADLYQRIKANADGLGLKCPSYYELTRMAQRHKGDQSFSTLFMELNGYNGVNVSGIDYYDNTKHGSVIYDLSKVDSDMEEISPKSLFTGYHHSSYNDTVVQDFVSDPKIEALKGYDLWKFKLNEIPFNDALRVLKNYMDSGNILDGYSFNEIGDDLKRRYLRLLFAKNPKNHWGDRLCDEVISGENRRNYIRAIDELRAYYWVNYESKKGSVLVDLLNNFSINLPWELTREEENEEKKSYLETLMTHMQRDLTQYEKEFIEEDYYS